MHAKHADGTRATASARLPGCGPAVPAVNGHAGLRAICVFRVHPFCICVEAFLRCRMPHGPAQARHPVARHRRIATRLAVHEMFPSRALSAGCAVLAANWCMGFCMLRLGPAGGCMRAGGPLSRCIGSFPPWRGPTWPEGGRALWRIGRRLAWRDRASSRPSAAGRKASKKIQPQMHADARRWNWGHRGGAGRHPRPGGSCGEPACRTPAHRCASACICG